MSVPTDFSVNHGTASHFNIKKPFRANRIVVKNIQVKDVSWPGPVQISSDDSTVPYNLTLPDHLPASLDQYLSLNATSSDLSQGQVQLQWKNAPEYLSFATSSVALPEHTSAIVNLLGEEKSTIEVYLPQQPRLGTVFEIIQPTHMNLLFEFGEEFGVISGWSQHEAKLQSLKSSQIVSFKSIEPEEFIRPSFRLVYTQDSSQNSYWQSLNMCHFFGLTLLNYFMNLNLVRTYGLVKETNSILVQIEDSAERVYPQNMVLITPTSTAPVEITPSLNQLTNIQGQCRFYMKSLTAQSVVFTFETTVQEQTVHASTTFHFYQEDTSLTVINRVLVPNGLDTTTVEVVFKDTAENVYANKQLQLLSNYNSDIISPSSVVTDEFGRASFTIRNNSGQSHASRLQVYNMTDDFLVERTASVVFLVRPAFDTYGTFYGYFHAGTVSEPYEIGSESRYWWSDYYSIDPMNPNFLHTFSPFGNLIWSGGRVNGERKENNPVLVYSTMVDFSFIQENSNNYCLFLRYRLPGDSKRVAVNIYNGSGQIFRIGVYENSQGVAVLGTFNGFDLQVEQTIGNPVAADGDWHVVGFMRTPAKTYFCFDELKYESTSAVLTFPVFTLGGDLWSGIQNEIMISHLLMYRSALSVDDFHSFQQYFSLLNAV